MNIKTFGKEFLAFGLKQASACIFGAYLLALMIGTKFWYPFSSVYRYDFLFISAIVFQFILLYFKLESFCKRQLQS